MATYVLHVVDQTEDRLVTRESNAPQHFDFIYEVVTGPFAGQRGTHRELSDLVADRVVVMSGMVGLSEQTGALLDWQADGTDDGVGHWTPRHRELIERAVGGS